MLNVVSPGQADSELRPDLHSMMREGARRMLAAALEAEVDDYLAAHAAERDERGRRLVVRNGHARQRQVHDRSWRGRGLRRGSTTPGSTR